MLPAPKFPKSPAPGKFSMRTSRLLAVSAGTFLSNRKRSAEAEAEAAKQKGFCGANFEVDFE
jgi:hypothetical protein